MPVLVSGEVSGDTGDRDVMVPEGGREGGREGTIEKSR